MTVLSSTKTMCSVKQTEKNRISCLEKLTTANGHANKTRVKKVCGESFDTHNKYDSKSVATDSPGVVT